MTVQWSTFAFYITFTATIFVRIVFCSLPFHSSLGWQSTPWFQFRFPQFVLCRKFPHKNVLPSASFSFIVINSLALFYVPMGCTVHWNFNFKCYFSRRLHSFKVRSTSNRADVAVSARYSYFEAQCLDVYCEQINTKRKTVMKLKL